MNVCRFAALFLVGASLTAQQPAASPVNTYGLEKEAALGVQMAAELRRRTTHISDSLAQSTSTV